MGIGCGIDRDYTRTDKDIKRTEEAIECFKKALVL
jgi:hypothetical protein